MQIFEGSIVFDEQNVEYDVIEYLDSGGFGNIYKIKSGDDYYALKTIHSDIFNEKDYKSFVNEAKTAIGIDHQNVIKYFFFHDGYKHENLPPYIIMELALNGSLRKLIESQTDFLSNEGLINIYSQLINGMLEISKKFIHRDLKPENILISSNVIKITDFGLSKLVGSSTRHTTFKGWGSFPYFAPEAWKFDKNTTQMDIYAMGVIFYELAALNHPLKVTENTFEAWRDAHLFKNPDNLENINSNISPIISRVISQMIEKDSSHRPANWKEVKSLLEKSDLPSTDDGKIIASLLSKRNEKYQKATEQRLMKEKREAEIQEKRKIILQQYHLEIIEPIKEFLDELNSQLIDNKIRYNIETNSFLNNIDCSYSHIKFDLNPIIREDFYREIQYSDFGMTQTRTELQIPHVDNREVLAWGYVQATDGCGFNILLLKKEDSIYGEWLLLFNRHRVMYRNHDNRPEPFPYSYKELELEIKRLNAAHVYVSERFSLDLNKIKEFLVQYFD